MRKNVPIHAGFLSHPANGLCTSLVMVLASTSWVSQGSWVVGWVKGGWRTWSESEQFNILDTEKLRCYSPFIQDLKRIFAASVKSLWDAGMLHIQFPAGWGVQHSQIKGKRKKSQPTVYPQYVAEKITAYWMEQDSTKCSPVPWAHRASGKWLRLGPWRTRTVEAARWMRTWRDLWRIQGRRRAMMVDGEEVDAIDEDHDLTAMWLCSCTWHCQRSVTSWFLEVMVQYIQTWFRNFVVQTAL